MCLDPSSLRACYGSIVAAIFKCGPFNMKRNIHASEDPYEGIWTQTFTKGDVVETRFHNGKWYKGTVRNRIHKGVSLGTPQLRIVYEDEDDLVVDLKICPTRLYKGIFTNTICIGREYQASLPKYNPSSSVCERGDERIFFDDDGKEMTSPKSSEDVLSDKLFNRKPRTPSPKERKKPCHDHKSWGNALITQPSPPESCQIG